MHGGYTICMVMCGSGLFRRMTTAVSRVAVAGTIALGIVRLTAGATTPLATGTAISASASLPLGQENNFAKRKEEAQQAVQIKSTASKPPKNVFQPALRVEKPNFFT